MPVQGAGIFPRSLLCGPFASLRQLHSCTTSAAAVRSKTRTSRLEKHPAAVRLASLLVLLRPIRFRLHSKLEDREAMITLRYAPAFVFRPDDAERPEERAALNPLKSAGTKLRWTAYRTNSIVRLSQPSAQRESKLSANPYNKAGLAASLTDILGEHKGRRAISPPRKMTLALDNGV